MKSILSKPGTVVASVKAPCPLFGYAQTKHLYDAWRGAFETKFIEAYFQDTYGTHDDSSAVVVVRDS
jgi:hypothetical protein